MNNLAQSVDFNLDDLTNSIISLLSPAAKTKNLSFEAKAKSKRQSFAECYLTYPLMHLILLQKDPSPFLFNYGTRIRAFEDSKKASVPIIALTGHARDSNKQDSLGAGMQAVLTKPADIEDLKKLLLKHAK